MITIKVVYNLILSKMKRKKINFVISVLILLLIISFKLFSYNSIDYGFMTYYICSLFELKKIKKLIIKLTLKYILANLRNLRILK
jgi:hypothetical protein